MIADLCARLPHQLAVLRDGSMAAHQRIRGVLARFGRHPHCNAVLGRPSALDELACIATGDFPHVRRVQVAPAT